MSLGTLIVDEIYVGQVTRIWLENRSVHIRALFGPMTDAVRAGDFQAVLYDPAGGEVVRTIIPLEGWQQGSQVAVTWAMTIGNDFTHERHERGRGW